MLVLGREGAVVLVLGREGVVVLVLGTEGPVVLVLGREEVVVLGTVSSCARERGSSCASTRDREQL